MCFCAQSIIIALVKALLSVEIGEAKGANVIVNGNKKIRRNDN